MTTVLGEKAQAVWLIGALYLLLALAYGAVNPLFEAPDEHWHYFTAQSIAEEGRLPRVSEPPDPWLGQEAAQPPLYYILGALIVAPFDTSAARELVWPNPRAALGDASAIHNVNAFVHGPWEAWPWRGYALAAHLLRAFSSLLGLGTLLFIYGSARELWPGRRRRALLAMALVAFLPQFLFIHSAVTNDALITLLCAAALWQLLRLWRVPAHKGHLLQLGLTIGLAILTKTAGLLLLPYACAVFVLRAGWRGEPLWPAIRRATVAVALPALLLGGWLLLRNWTLYGDVAAANQFVQIAGGDRGYTAGEVLAEWPGLWTSLFSLFGWFNLRAPQWIYVVWNGVVLLAVGGALYSEIARMQRRAAQEGARIEKSSERRDGQTMALWLGLWALLVYAALFAFMLRTPAAQGRLLFPALVPLALGMVYGLDRLWAAIGGLLGRHPAGVWWRRLQIAIPATALVTSIYSVAVVIPRSYEKPELLAASSLPPGATSLQIEFDDGLTLMGYRLQAAALEPSHVTWMTLFWRSAAERPIGRQAAPELVVELFGRQEALVGKFQGYHGGGLYPATLWPEDMIVAERLGVPLTGTMRAPAVVRVQVGLAHSTQRVTLGALEVEPEQWPAISGGALAQLGQAIALAEATMTPTEVSAGDTVRVTLAWRVQQDVNQAFTSFVHLGQLSQAPLAQGDGQPLAGDYPTVYWDAGELISGDEYLLEIPQSLLPGRYPIHVGMYDPQTLQRLPLFVDGQRQAQDAFLLGWVTAR